MDPFIRAEELKKEWVDQYVTVNPEIPELKRFANIVGRVVTVNFNGKALVDFQDGGWYDISANPQCLNRVDKEEGAKKYKNVNSAQVAPEKQGA